MLADSIMYFMKTLDTLDRFVWRRAQCAQCSQFVFIFGHLSVPGHVTASKRRFVMMKYGPETLNPRQPLWPIFHNWNKGISADRK